MWLLLLSCNGTHSTADIIKTFEKNPKQAYQVLSTIEDPLERLSVIELLSKNFPGQTTELCELIDNSTSKTACITQNQRPHLWMQSKEESNPSNSKETVLIECTTQNHQQCVQRYASKAANANAPQRAIQICNNIVEQKWRDECIFVVAENSVAQKGSKAYASAVELCQQAGNFADNCQQHLILQFSQWAPDSDSLSDWKKIFSAHNAIKTTWGWRDKEQQIELQHRLWAEAVGTSFAGSNRITGNTLDIIPLEFQPHIYAAAARRLFQLEEPDKHSLTEWAHKLLLMLEQRTSKPESLNEQRRFLAVANLWDTQQHSSINYMATSRREHSSDPLIDIQICILEAIARKPPIVQSILQEGSTSPQEEVSRTALRLLQKTAQ